MEEKLTIVDSVAREVGILVQAPTKELQKFSLQNHLLKVWMNVILEKHIYDKGCLKIDEDLITIELSCGMKVSYKTIFDVPLETTMCPCGNPNHYITQFQIIE
jgi:transposase